MAHKSPSVLLALLGCLMLGRAQSQAQTDCEIAAITWGANCTDCADDDVSCLDSYIEQPACDVSSVDASSSWLESDCECDLLLNNMFCEASAIASVVLDGEIANVDDSFEEDCALWLADLADSNSTRIRIDNITGGSIIVTFSIFTRFGESSTASNAALTNVQTAVTAGAEFRSLGVVDLAVEVLRCLPGSAESNGLCADCLPGQYSDGSLPCDECEAGQYAGSAGLEECTMCDAGYYAPEGSIECDECPSGHHDQDQNPATACDNDESLCPNGTHSDIAAISCTNCTIGFADGDNNPSTPCEACPGGTYAGQAEVSCQSCDSGQADLDNNASTPCDLCGPGFFSATAGASICNDCAAGTVQPEAGQPSCTECEAGTFDNDTEVCEDCGPGFFSATAGASICNDCDAGTVQPEVGQPSCTQCEAGTFDNGTEVCEDCTAGFVQPYAGQTGCDACQAGFYDNGTEVCSACVDGSVQPDSNQTQCIACEPGFFDARTSETCTDCDAGTVQPNSSQTQCIACSPGSYDAGTEECQLCMPGRQAPDSGMAECTICTPGRHAPGNGTEHCSECPGGTSSSSTVGTNQSVHGLSDNFTQCDPCDAGRYSIAGGLCELCDAGQHTASHGLDSCDACQAGYVSTETRQECSACPPGMRSESEIASVVCLNCTTGMFSNEYAVSDCIDCSPGQYQDMVGMTMCISCLLGRIVQNNGSVSEDNCTSCLPGRYSTNGVECSDCEAGKHSDPNPGGVQCVLCENGRYAGVQHVPAASCVACELGRFANETQVITGTRQGRTDCDDCASGQYTDTVETHLNCLLCPAGRELPSTGGGDINDCTSCGSPTDRRRHAPDNGTQQCILCQPGFVANNSFTTCDPCPAGKTTHSTEGRQCTDCEPGFFSLEAAPNCTACDKGRYSPEYGAIFCPFCDVGKFSNSTANTAAEDCIDCPIGRYANFSTQPTQSCTWCTTGTIGITTSTPAANASSDCVQCRPGKSWMKSMTEVGEAGLCMACLEGKYQPHQGGVNCLNCTAGRYANEPESDNCKPCESGRYLPDLCTDGSRFVIDPCREESNVGEYRLPQHRIQCLKCPAGRGMDNITESDNVEACQECQLGRFFNPEDFDETEAPNEISCQQCAAGQNTYGGGATKCALCPGDADRPEYAMACTDTGCKTGHKNAEGSFCASCMEKGNCDDLDKDASGQCLLGTEETIGYFIKGAECAQCGNALMSLVISVGSLIIATTYLSYHIVKGFKKENVDAAQGGMDFTRAVATVLKQFQRLTTVLVLPFGWPLWLRDLCFYLKQVVAFDFPGLAAPECQAPMSPGEAVEFRTLVAAAALPVIWFLMGVEMWIIRCATKMGRKKRERIGFRPVFQTVVITMHGVYGYHPLLLSLLPPRCCLTLQSFFSAQHVFSL
eukprot:SAG31_NODE_257_length_18942_cov_6.099135_14_plen_1402_part_00